MLWFLEERLNVVETFIENSEMRHYVYKDQLRRIPDFQRIAKKFQRKRASLQDCYKVYQAIAMMPKLLSCLEIYNGEHEGLLKELFVTPIKV